MQSIGIKLALLACVFVIAGSLALNRTVPQLPNCERICLEYSHLEFDGFVKFGAEEGCICQHGVEEVVEERTPDHVDLMLNQMQQELFNMRRDTEFWGEDPE